MERIAFSAKCLLSMTPWEIFSWENIEGARESGPILPESDVTELEANDSEVMEAGAKLRCETLLGAILSLVKAPV